MKRVIILSMFLSGCAPYAYVYEMPTTGENTTDSSPTNLTTRTIVVEKPVYVAAPVPAPVVVPYPAYSYPAYPYSGFFAGAVTGALLNRYWGGHYHHRYH